MNTEYINGGPDLSFSFSLSLGRGGEGAPSLVAPLASSVSANQVCYATSLVKHRFCRINYISIISIRYYTLEKHISYVIFGQTVQ